MLWNYSSILPLWDLAIGSGLKSNPSSREEPGTSRLHMTMHAKQSVFVATANIAGAMNVLSLAQESTPITIAVAIFIVDFNIILSQL